MRHIIVRNGVIENSIELSENGYTSTFIENEAGDRYPTSVINGVTKITNQYLIPEGYEIYASEIGEIGDSYPIIEQPTN